MENHMKFAYLIYPGLWDETVRAYIQEVSQVLGSLGYLVFDPANFLHKKNYPSEKEWDADKRIIRDKIKEASLIVEIVRGNDVYRERLKEPQTETALSIARSSKKQIVVLMPSYRCGSEEFAELSKEKKEAFFKEIPQKAIIAKGISDILTEIKQLSAVAV